MKVFQYYKRIRKILIKYINFIINETLQNAYKVSIN